MCDSWAEGTLQIRSMSAGVHRLGQDQGRFEGFRESHRVDTQKPFVGRFLEDALDDPFLEGFGLGARFRNSQPWGGV